MIDREKVQKGLECCCGGGMCFHGCPYHEVSQSVEGCTSQLASDVLGLLKEQPDIVRCKDCKHFLADETCGNPRLCDQEDISTSGPDWFCADGERRETND